MECQRCVQDDELLDSDDEEGERLNNAKELAGMRVRHDADELGEGETMILTLADRNILDEHGDVDEDKDELENALVVCLCGASLLAHLLTHVYYWHVTLMLYRAISKCHPVACTKLL